jgi:hypothetical protein
VRKREHQQTWEDPLSPYMHEYLVGSPSRSVLSFLEMSGWIEPPEMKPVSLESKLLGDVKVWSLAAKLTCVAHLQDRRHLQP